MTRDVRIRQIPDRFDGRKWHTKPQPVVRLGDVGKWSMVRHADHPCALPFVISRKDWDKLPAKAIEAQRAETVKHGSVHESAVGADDLPITSQEKGE